MIRVVFVPRDPVQWNLSHLSDAELHDAVKIHAAGDAAVNSLVVRGTTSTPSDLLPANSIVAHGIFVDYSSQADASCGVTTTMHIAGHECVGRITGKCSAATSTNGSGVKKKRCRGEEVDHNQVVLVGVPEDMSNAELVKCLEGLLGDGTVLGMDNVCCGEVQVQLSFGAAYTVLQSPTLDIIRKTVKKRRDKEDKKEGGAEISLLVHTRVRRPIAKENLECFELATSDEVIAALLECYKAKGSVLVDEMGHIIIPRN